MEIKQALMLETSLKAAQGVAPSWWGAGRRGTHSQREIAETEQEECETTACPGELTHVSLLCAHVHSLPVRRPVCHAGNACSCVPGHRRFAHTSGS